MVFMNSINLRIFPINTYVHVAMYVRMYVWNLIVKIININLLVAIASLVSYIISYSAQIIMISNKCMGS